MTGIRDVSVHDTEGSKFCGAKTRHDGSPCRRPAGWGTDHPGQGRCKLHAGCSPIKHGRYSKVLRPALRKKYEAAKSDPDILNLRSELALLRAQLQQWLEKTGEAQDDGFEASLRTSAGLTELITKVVERIHKIEVGEKYTITIEGVENVINRVVGIINTHVTDPKLRNKIAADLADLHL